MPVLDVDGSAACPACSAGRAGAGLPRLQVRAGGPALLSTQAGHDTYLAAYLLAPGRPRLPAGPSSPARRHPGSGLRAAERPVRLRPPSCCALAAWQERALREQGMWELFRQIELPLTAVLMAMEEAGIHLDCYRLGEITGKIQDQLEELEARIYELAGETFNLGSPQQLGQDPLRAPGASPPAQDQDRILHRCQDPGGAAGQPPHRGLPSEPPRTLQADVHLPAGPAANGRSGYRAAAHHVPSDGGGYRPAVVERPEPAEHPGAYRPGGADPAVLHGRAGLLAWWWPTTRRSSCASWPISPASRRCSKSFARGRRHPHPHGGRGVRSGGGGGGRDSPTLRQGGQFRHHVRHLGLSASARTWGSSGKRRPRTSSATSSGCRR